MKDLLVLLAHLSTTLAKLLRAVEAFVEAAAPGKPIVYYPKAIEVVFSAPSRGEQPDVAGLDRGFPVVFTGKIGTAQAVDVIVVAASLLRVYAEIHPVVLGGGRRGEWLYQQVTSLHDGRKADSDQPER